MNARATIIGACFALAACGSDSETANQPSGTGGEAAGGSAGDSAEGGDNAGGSTTGGTTAGGTGGAAGNSTTGGSSGHSGSGGTGGSAGNGAGGNGATGGSAGNGGNSNGPLTVDDCFNQISGGVTIDYDQYGPVVGSHCFGTNHQDIKGVERIVFLGDSVTEGTPPSSLGNNHFRALLGGADLLGLPIKQGSLQTTFPDAAIDNCAKWGARTDDFIRDGGQMPECWPDLFAGGNPKAVGDASDSRSTLVIFTMGGNDIFNWADNALEGQTALDAAEKAAQYLEDAVAFFKEPGRFPNGVHVIYGNPYEYTDATGDTGSCVASAVVGLQGNQLQLAPAVTHFTERYLEIAVKYQADMIFMLEGFCGHGFHHQDTQSQCYRGPGAELWFDLTCIHPNDAGHAALAEMFQAVVDE
jgi:hypothetical protein